MARVTCVDPEALATATAERLTELIDQAVAASGAALVSLTGGSTPRQLYETLASGPWRQRIDWSRVHLFWGDERHVPPNHPDSNFGMANAALVAHVPIPASHVHRMRGEIADAQEAAREYDRELRDAFASAGRHDRAFDVMLLGLGEDAHIASIFPGSELLQPGRGRSESQAADGDTPRPVRLDGPAVAAVYAAHLGTWRITLTPPALLNSRAILMLVAGEEKAGAVRAALELPPDLIRYPAQLLREAAGRVEWFIDRGAGSRLRDARTA